MLHGRLRQASLAVDLQGACARLDVALMHHLGLKSLLEDFVGFVESLRHRPFSRAASSARCATQALSFPALRTKHSRDGLTAPRALAPPRDRRPPTALHTQRR